MSTGKIGPSKTLSADDWIRAAMDAIVEGGVAAVSIEPLAARLGATKGSFYHHFQNRDALIVAALDEWERSQTEAVIERLQLLPDPAERLRAVLAAALIDGPGGVRDAALLGSATHPLVKPVVERVTARRLAYFTEMLVKLGFPRERARHRAWLLYSSYLGLFDCTRVGIDPKLREAELGRFVEEFLSTLIPDSDQVARARR